MKGLRFGEPRSIYSSTELEGPRVICSKPKRAERGEGAAMKKRSRRPPDQTRPDQTKPDQTQTQTRQTAAADTGKGTHAQVCRPSRLGPVTGRWALATGQCEAILAHNPPYFPAAWDGGSDKHISTDLTAAIAASDKGTRARDTGGQGWRKVGRLV